MIDIRDLTIAHRGGAPLLESASASVAEGTLCAFIGRNGAGKSSLLRVMAGIDRPRAGTVVIGGTDVTAARPWQLARKLAIVTTERVRVADLSCRDVVSLGRAPFTGGFGQMSAADNKVVDDAMELVGVGTFASRSISTLSDGEAQRVMLARAIAQDTPVILLDEPTSFLDVPNRHRLTSLLSMLAHDRGKTIFFSTHELDLAFSRADSVMLLEDRRLLHLSAKEMGARFAASPWV